MKKFLVLYKASIEEFQKAMKMSKEEMDKSKKDWDQWMEKNKSSLSDMGAPLGKTKQVTQSGVSDIKNDIGGYSIVTANIHEEAAKIFMDNPHFEMLNNATIEVMEILEM